MNERKSYWVGPIDTLVKVDPDASDDDWQPDRKAMDEKVKKLKNLINILGKKDG